MRVASATPRQVGIDWFPYPFDPFTYPNEIRETVKALIAKEEQTGVELNVVTMNRTLLDMIRASGSKNAADLDLYYEDVLLWDGEKLSPLLEHYSTEWLSHFSLGDLFDRGELDPWRSS